MKKQKLSLNELKVSSFITAIEADKRGGADADAVSSVIVITTIKIEVTKPLPEQSEGTVSCLMACESHEYRGCVKQVENPGGYDIIR